MKILKALFLLSTFMVFGSVNAADITLYYSPTCPHCHHARDFIENQLIYEYDDLKVTLVNAFENRDEFISVIKKCKYDNGGVPVLVIGEKCFQGYGESMNGEIRSAVEIDLTDTQKQNAANNKASLEKDKKAFVSSHENRKDSIVEVKKKITSEPADNTNIALIVIMVLLAGALSVVLLKKQK